MITVYESFFTEVKDSSTRYVQFLPVSKTFFQKKLRELKKLSDKNTVLIVNQMIMSMDVNKSRLNSVNTKFNQQCKRISEENTFCEVINHNSGIVDNQDLMIPYLSSDSYVLFNKKLIVSYAK